MEPSSTRLAVGRGTTLFLLGTCRHATLPIRTLDIVLDGRAWPTVAHGLDLERPDSFWAVVPIEPTDETRRADVSLRARLANGATATQDLTAIDLAPALEHIDAGVSVPPGSGPLVAICMASYEPPPELLQRQIASIRAQSHERWVCLISDDCSSPESFERLRALTSGDPRFAVSRSPTRLGLYANFERAMTMVPSEATHVALADQDDVWYPEKLATLLEAIGDASLVYADMRVVSETGETLSESYWHGRRNNFTNLSSLLLANTVTGAASLFRRALLDLALPLPPKTPDAFHDQWLASVALATGEMAYVDRPLHSYVQHGASELGHAAAVRGFHPRRLVRITAPRASIRAIAHNARNSYRLNVMRIAVSASTLEKRAGGRLAGAKRRAIRRLARLGSAREPFAWLALRRLRGIAGRNETVGIELSLAAAVAWRHLARAGRRR